LMSRQDTDLTIAQAWQGKFRTSPGHEIRPAAAGSTVAPPRPHETAYWRGYALARTCLNRELLSTVPRNSSVLEVGVDKGVQLRCLGSLGFHRTAGTHILLDVVQHACSQAPDALGVQASAMHLPFADASFDLVCTSGLLSSLCDGRMERLMHELYRCSRRWIWGWERLDVREAAARMRVVIEPPIDLATAWRDSFRDLRIVRAHWLPSPMQGGGFQTFLLEKSRG
jgi:hypothetical protein